MAQLAIAAAGAYMGTAFGWGMLGMTGAQVGWMAGTLLGSAFVGGQDAQGPRLGDLKVSGTDYGQTLPWVAGSPRISGQVVWASDKREIAHTESAGKGGGSEYTSYTYEVDVLYLLTENVISGVSRIWSNGELVFDGETTKDGIWSDLIIYTGASNQLPDPTYEASVGLGNAPAYRGRGSVMVKALQLGSSGQLPNITFEVGSIKPDQVYAPLQIFPWSFTTTNGSLCIKSDWPVHGICLGGKIEATVQCVGGKSGWNELPDKHTSIASALTQAQQYAVAHGTVAWSDFWAYWSSDDPFCNLNSAGANISTDPDYVYLIFAPSGFNPYFVDSSNNYANIEWMPRWWFDNGFMPNNRIDVYNAREGFKAFFLGNSSAAGGNPNESIFIPCNNMTEGYSPAWPLGYFPSLYFYYLTVIKVRRILTPPKGYEESTVPKYSTRQLKYTDIESAINLSNSPIGPLLTSSDPNFNNEAWWTNQINISGRGSPQQYFDQVWLTYEGSTKAAYAFGAFWDIVGKKTFMEGSKVISDIDHVVDDLAARAGYQESDLDSAINSEKPLRGFAIGNVSSTRSSLEALQKSWFFECASSDKIYIKPRSTEVVAVIPFEDIGSPEGDAISLTTSNDQEIPAQISLSFNNMESDYNVSTENSDRLLSIQQTTLSMQMPIGMYAAEAKSVVDTLLLDQVTSMTKASIIVPIKYAYLDPGDLIVVNDLDGRSYKLRISTKRDNLTHLQLECLFDDVQSLTSESITDTGYTGSVTVMDRAQTVMVPLDIPLLRDVDDSPGFYVAIAPAVSSTPTEWSGASVLTSWDGVTYETLLSSSAACTIGTCSTVLPTWGGSSGYDETSQLTVVTNKSLSSSTVEAMALDPTINVLLVGSEVIRFVNAQLVAANTYVLSKLVRGYRGTEWAISGHASNETCVLLNNALRRVSTQSGDMFKSRYLKAVTLGSFAANATAVTFTDMAICLKPFSVKNLAISPATGTSFTLTWDRRSRLSPVNGNEAPLSTFAEGTVESYWVEVYKGATLLTTVPVAGSHSLTFNASTYGFTTGDKVKFVVYQHGTIHDKGYPASIEGTYQ